MKPSHGSDKQLDFEAIDYAFRIGRPCSSVDAELKPFLDFIWGQAALLVGEQGAEDLLQKFIEKMQRRGGPCRMGFDPTRGLRHSTHTAEQSSQCFKAWLSSSIWNEARTYWRSRKRERQRLLETEEGLDQVPDPVPVSDDDERLNAAERRMVMQDWVDQLSLLYREILYLRYWCDLSEAEAAAELGISIWASKKRHQRAIHALSKIIAATAAPGMNLPTPARP